jgi:lysozyme
MAFLLTLPMVGQQPHVPAPTSDLPVSALYRNSAVALYRITPERRALLNTIRYAEGTWLGGGAEGYRTMFGGGRIESLDRHPEITVHRGYASAAAGAYQFLPDTWRAVALELKLTDFRPDSQDQAALHLVQKRGALRSFDREGLSQEVLTRLSLEWASLPDNQVGGSAYGQPAKGSQELQHFYLKELERQRRVVTA